MTDDEIRKLTSEGINWLRERQQDRRDHTAEQIANDRRVNVLTPEDIAFLRDVKIKLD